jgi:penicillin-binding protein 1C
LNQRFLVEPGDYWLLLNRYKVKFLRFLGILVGVVLVIKFTFLLLPYPSLSGFLNSSYSLDITDRNGKLLYTTTLENGLKRHRLFKDDLDSIDIDTVLGAEDRVFYFHYGLNPISLIKALYINNKEKRTVSGASTITMQLARIITPRPKGNKSKILEILDAIKLESRLSKKDILALYLSHVPFGRNIEGYKSAADFYFNKEINELSPVEMNILTLIPRSPANYDPINNGDKIIARLSKTLDEANLLEVTETLNNIKTLQLQRPKNPINAPHFVNYVISNLQINDYKKGRGIVTTLDLDVQNWINNKLKGYLELTKGNRVSNGAVLLLKDNNILAYIGSGDFYSIENNGQIDGVQILRQPGSTLKPFLYELAFERGFTPASVLPDIPSSFGSEEVYRPENYSQTYHGPVRIRVALASSFNIPAVYMLERLGVNNFTQRLISLGFNSLKGREEHLGLGLAVGNAEVSLFELTRAFSIFKNNGILYQNNWLLKSEYKDHGLKVAEVTESELIRDILSDKQARIPGFGRNSVLNTPFPAYFKTGTSNQFNNIWALGATSDLTCGVWMGNFNGNTVIGRPGSSIPARIVLDIFNEYSLKEDFTNTQIFEEKTICKLSGGLATRNCPHTTTEKFKQGTVLPDCSYHSADGRVNLPTEYSQWSRLYSYDLYSVDKSISADVKSPRNGGQYYISPNLSPKMFRV